MAEKTENFLKVKSAGDSWIIARSKKYSDRIYYFNTETGHAVWNLSETDLTKAKEIDNLTAGKFPEPNEPPSDLREIQKIKNYEHSRVRPRVYNKQIINNEYSKPCIFQPFMPFFPAQEMAMQYTQNVWAVPPQQQFYIAPIPMPNGPLGGLETLTPDGDSCHTIRRRPMPTNPFPTQFMNPFSNINQFSNPTNANNVPKERPVFANTYTSAQPKQEVFSSLHRTTGTILSEKFKSLNSSRSSVEMVEPNRPRATMQKGIQDLRQLLIAKRIRNNSNCSGSLEDLSSHENKSYEQENTTEDIEDQLEDLHVKESPEQGSIENAGSSFDNEDDKWLSKNVQLRGSKTVIDVEPLKHILGSNEDVWYLIPDITVLLSNMVFLNVLVNSDEQCRIVIPRGIYEALQVKARGGHRGALGGRARSACRLVAQLVKSEQAFIDHQEESSSHDVDSFENSCARLIEMKSPFVALSNDKHKLEKIKAMYPVAFSVEEVKEYLTLDRTQIENDITNQAMTITIPNNTSGNTPAAKTEKTKIVYSPMKNTADSSNNTTETQKELTVIDKRREIAPTPSPDKVDTETQVTFTTPKKMVNAEVQTDLFLIENLPVFKAPESFSKNTQTNVKPAPSINKDMDTVPTKTNLSDEISTVKRREIRLRRNVVQTSSTNPITTTSNPLEKKLKWWRRKKVDLAKPVASESVKNDLTQTPEIVKHTIQTPNPGTDSTDGVETCPETNITKRITASPKVDLQTSEKCTKSLQKTKPSSPVKTTGIASAKTITKHAILPPKMVLSPIKSKEKSANFQQNTSADSSPVKSPRAAVKPVDIVIPEKLKMTPKPQTSYTQTGLIRTIFSPIRDAYKSPESYTDVQSPKIMQNMSQELMQRTIEESTSSSDIVSMTRSSACSEKSIILKSTQSPSIQRSIKDPNTNKNMFEITDDAMEESLKNGSDEWISRFVQIMEEVLSQVLQLDPSPWMMIELTECIKNKYKSNIGVRTTATEFLAVVTKVMDNDRGDIRRDLTPSTFLEILSYAVNFVLELQLLLPACEDISIGLESLYKLVNDMKNYNNEPMEFADTEMFEESCGVTSREQNDQNNCKKGDKIPDTISTPTRQTDQVDTNPPQVKFVRRFNTTDSFEKLMQKRNETLTQRSEITYDCNEQAQNQKRDSPKTIQTDSPKILDKEKNSSPVVQRNFSNFESPSFFARDSFDFKPQIGKKIDSPQSIAQQQTQFKYSPAKHSKLSFQREKVQKENKCKSRNSPQEAPKSSTPVQSTKSPKNKDKTKESVLDFDLLDYSENFDYTEEKLDCVDDNLNFVSKDNDFNDSIDFDEYNMSNMAYTASCFEDTLNEDFHKISGYNVKEALEASDDKPQLIVKQFQKEMKETFLHVNSFCQQTYKELIEVSKLTTIRKMELLEQAEKEKFHINNLLNNLNRISSRERNGSELQAISRRYNGIQLTYRDIIEKCSSQARILIEVLAPICAMLESALK